MLNKKIYSNFSKIKIDEYPGKDNDPVIRSLYRQMKVSKRPSHISSAKPKTRIPNPPEHKSSVSLDTTTLSDQDLVVQSILESPRATINV